MLYNVALSVFIKIKLGIKTSVKIYFCANSSGGMTYDCTTLGTQNDFFLPHLELTHFQGDSVLHHVDSIFLQKIFQRIVSEHFWSEFGNLKGLGHEIDWTFVACMGRSRL